MTTRLPISDTRTTTDSRSHEPLQTRMTSHADLPSLRRVFAVTTAPVSAPAQIARVGAPGRKQGAPTRQRISTVVLVVGTVLSLGSLFGPDWALRAGVVVALVSAVVSCALAWRELYLTKRKHARELLTAGRRHTEDLRAERQHNAGVLDTVSQRVQRWRHEVDRQQAQIAGLRVEVTALRSNVTSVRRQLVRANGVIGDLCETVRERDIEISLLRTTDPGTDAELHALPRRPEHDRPAAGPTFGDQVRTVVELRVEEPALPNFEADRRLA